MSECLRTLVGKLLKSRLAAVGLVSSSDQSEGILLNSAKPLPPPPSPFLPSRLPPPMLPLLSLCDDSGRSCVRVRTRACLCLYVSILQSVCQSVRRS